MPYPSEHTARVRDPDEFQPNSFRSKTLPKSEGGKGGVRMILGRLREESTMTVQAYRFPADSYSVEEAKSWLQENDVTYISFEEASGAKAADLPELTLDDVTRLVWDALTPDEERKPMKPYPMDVKIYDDHMTYQFDGKHYTRTYGIVDGKLQLGEPVEFEMVMRPAEAVKAIEDGEQWIIEGFGAPYYGPESGKDLAGEYFSAKTDFGLDYYPSRPVVFHHGLTEKDPEVIGQELSVEERKGGKWVRVLLDKSKALAKTAWELAKKGKLFYSSGAIAHLVRKATDGHLDKWPVAEWSLTPQPINKYAVATAAAKSRFKAIGIEFDDGASSDGGGEPPEERGEEMPPVEETPTKKTGGVNVGEVLTQEQLNVMVAAAVKSAQEQAATASKAAAEQAELEQLRKDVPDLRKEVDALKAQMNRKGIFPENEGDDKVTVIGSFWDKQDAADREMVAMMLQGAGKPISEDLRRSLKGGLQEGLAAAAPYLRQEGLLDAQVKAIALMDKTDTANWVPANYEQRVWDRLRLENRAAAQFTNMDLPTDSYYLPTGTAGPTVYKVPEQTAGTPTLSTGITTSQITDAKVTFATGKMGCAVWFSGELDEDGIIPQLPIVRDQMAKAMDEGVEGVLLNGDKTTGTKSITVATAATTDACVIADGLRHFGLVGATTFKRDCGALDIDDAIAIRQLMGKYGIRPSDLVWFCDYNTIYKIIGFDEFMTVDKLGSKAVVVAGEVGELLGSPLVVSGEMNKYGADGKFHATPTTGILICAHKPSWIVGWRRRIKFGVNYFDNVDSTRVTSLLRMDFESFGTTYGHACVGYNITL